MKRVALRANLGLNVIDLELEIDSGILDPLETGVEVVQSLLHVIDLLLLGVIAAEKVQVGSFGVLALRLLHLLTHHL